MLTATVTETALVVMGTVAVVCPAGIVTVAGSAAAGLSVVRVTAAPPAGAG